MAFMLQESKNPTTMTYNLAWSSYWLSYQSHPGSKEVIFFQIVDVIFWQAINFPNPLVLLIFSLFEPTLQQGPIACKWTDLALTHTTIMCTQILLVFISDSVIVFSSQRVAHVFGTASHWVAFECACMIIQMNLTHCGGFLFFLSTFMSQGLHRKHINVLFVTLKMKNQVKKQTISTSIPTVTCVSCCRPLFTAFYWNSAVVLQSAISQNN